MCICYKLYQDSGYTSNIDQTYIRFSGYFTDLILVDLRWY